MCVFSIQYFIFYWNYIWKNYLCKVKTYNNTYILILPPYMHIYLVVNVENMKLYEPSLLDHEEEYVICFIEDLAMDFRWILYRI